MKKTIAILSLVISIGAAFAAEPETTLSEVRKAIDQGNRQWVDAWDKADASLIAALFAGDGVMLGRNGKLFKGPAQILERMKKVLESAGKGAKATVTTVDLWLDGETAYETGTYTYKFQENGKPVNDEGRYVTIWKRQSDGSWKIASDMGVPKD
ncbi:MAG TPA: nuclear transport factor 2 family protein [Chthoniobacterales bacterium]|nr:nuclear transport factor 2 family protein [Chthoniobacterales bacterium]